MVIFFYRAVYIQKNAAESWCLRDVAIITDYFISKFFLSEHAQVFPRQHPQHSPHAPFREAALSFFESLNKSRHATITAIRAIIVFSIKISPI